MTDSKKKGKESILKRYVDTIVLHIVFELYGKECKVNVYRNEISIQLFYTFYLNKKEKKCKVNVYGNEIYIQLFYTLYLNHIWKHYFPMNCTLTEIL